MPAKRRPYRAGQRALVGYTPGKISIKRYAWVDIFLGKFVLSRANPWEDRTHDKTAGGEGGYGVKIIVPNISHPRYPIHLRLTSLTEKELDLLEKFLKLAFDLARPIVKERDRVAREAAESGDVSFGRTWRQEPQFVIRDNTELLEAQAERRAKALADALEAGEPEPPPEEDAD